MKKMLTIILCGLAAVASAVTNQSATNITTTSAWARVSVSTGTPVLQLHYGMIDADTNLTWASTNSAVTGAVGTVSQQITGLTNSSRYYYRFRNNSTTNWAAGGSIRFYTAATSPTGTPSPSANAVMVHPTTAVLLAPTNFFGANTTALNNALSGFYDPTGSAVTVQADLDDHKTNINVHAITAITGLQTALDGKAGTNDMAQAEADITDLQTATNSLDGRVSIVETSKVDYANATYTDTVALAASALQSGDAGTWTNLSEYNNDLSGWATNHNDLENIQGGGATERYHLSLADYNSVTGGITGWDLAYGWGDWGTNFGVSAGQIYGAANGAAVSGQVVTIQGRTNAWNTGATDAAGATTDVAVLETDFDGHTNNEAADIQHLTSAQKLLATNSVQLNNTNYLSIIRSMTNFVAVASATNYLAYDPATRLLSGCITNSGGDASGWSGYAATSTVNMAGFPLTNMTNIAMSLYLDVTETNDTASVLWPGINSLAAYGGQRRTLISMRDDNQFRANFLVLSPHDKTNLFLDGGSYDKVMVLSQVEDEMLKVGIGRLPGTAGAEDYALDVAGAIRAESMVTTNLAVTNIQITGGSTSNGAIWAKTNANGTGTCVLYPKIWCGKGDAQVFTNNVNNVVNFTVTNRMEGGIFDGTSWVPNFIGWLDMSIRLAFEPNTGASGNTYITIWKNNAVFEYGTFVYYSGASAHAVGSRFFVYNDSTTNSYYFTYQPQGFGATNRANVNENLFTGFAVP